MRAPILIASPPRSGSSLTARYIHALGFFGGKMKRGDRWNRHGYYENEAVKQLVVSYLRSHDTHGLGKQFQPVGLDTPWAGFRDEVCKMLQMDGWQEGEPWFYKDVKLPLCWRLWHEHFPEARWVIVERDRQQVLESLLRTPFMSAYEKPYQWERFLDRYGRIFREMEQHCTTYRLQVSRVMEGDWEPLAGLRVYVDHRGEEVAARVIDREIWNA